MMAFLAMTTVLMVVGVEGSNPRNECNCNADDWYNKFGDAGQQEEASSPPGWVIWMSPSSATYTGTIPWSGVKKVDLYDFGTLNTDYMACDLKVKAGNGYFTPYLLRTDGSLVAWTSAVKSGVLAVPGDKPAMSHVTFCIILKPSGCSSDHTPPVITLVGGNMTVGCSSPFTDPGATATDNCCVGPVTVTGTVNTSVPGDYVLYYNASDCHGNAATTVTRTVHVVDTTPSVITLNGLATITLECGVGTYIEQGATVTDNCCPGPLVVAGTVDTVNVGTYVVSYNSTDCHGNAATTKYRTVHVVDTTAPVITGCPTGTKVNNGAGQCGAVVTWVLPTASDACCLFSFTSDWQSGSLFPVGSTVVTYAAKDCNGHTTTCSFTVTVVDIEKPVITLVGGNMTVGCSSPFTDPGATATDNCCAGPLVVAGTVDMANVGTYVISYDSTDCQGNAAVTKYRTVHVVDTIAPAIIGCPGNISVGNDSGQCGAVVSWTLPTAYDACCLSSFSSDWLPGSFFPVGFTVVTYTAEDCNGHVTTCSFTVTVADVEKPVITLNGPATITLECEVGTYTEQGATVTDNCCLGPLVITGTISTSVPGDYVLYYNASDCHDNVATTVTRTVHIVSTTPPVLPPVLEDPVVHTYPFSCCDCSTQPDVRPAWPPTLERVLDLSEYVDWDIVYPATTPNGGVLMNVGDTLFYSPPPGSDEAEYVLDSFPLHLAKDGMESNTITVYVLLVAPGQYAMVWSMQSGGENTLTLANGQHATAYLVLERALLGLGGAELLLRIGDPGVVGITGVSVVNLPEECLQVSIDDEGAHVSMGNPWQDGVLVQPFDAETDAEAVIMLQVDIVALGSGTTNVTPAMIEQPMSPTSISCAYGTLMPWQLVDFNGLEIHVP